MLIFARLQDKMRPETFIASRLFSLNAKQVSSSIVKIARLSVAIGLAVMMISVAVVIGFKNQIRDKVTGFVADIRITALNNNLSVEASPLSFSTELEEVLASHPDEIDHYQLVAEKAGILKTENEILGVVLKGVGTDYDWNYLSTKIVWGSLPVFNDSVASDRIIISKKIASKLKVSTNDPLRMWFVDGDNARTRGRKFIVSGIYETGLVEFDERYVLGDVQHVQHLYNWNKAQFGAVELTANDKTAPADLAGKLYYSVPANLDVKTAEEENPQLFDWLELQDMNVWIILILMVLVSGITMVSTLLIIILERTNMIGILKAMGANNAFIRRIFLINSYRILFSGMLWGNIFAIAFILLQANFGFLKLPEESYYLSEVPVELSLFHFTILNLGVFILWSVTLLIPVSVVNAIQPYKAIRYA